MVSIDLSDEKAKRGSSAVYTNTSFLEECEENTVVQNENDQDQYNDERDHLDIFPPTEYRKGDIELGVLMSG